MRWRCDSLLMGMSWCKCPFVGMSWCKCSDPDTNYSKIPFIFKTRLPQCLKPKYFQKLDVLFMKSHLPFDLRLLKNWWSLFETSEWGIDLESDDLAQKIYFHNLVEQKGWLVSVVFWKKMTSLKIKHLKKIHFFLVSEYDNLTGVKTHRDRLGNSGDSILEQRVQIFGFGKGRGPHKGFGCCLVVALSFFRLLRPWVFKIFRFCFRLPFRGFTLESCSFFPFSFFLFHHFFDCLIMHLTIHLEQVNGLSRILAEDKRQQPLLITKKISSRKKLFSPSIHTLIKMDFSGT